MREPYYFIASRFVTLVDVLSQTRKANHDLFSGYFTVRLEDDKITVCDPETDRVMFYIAYLTLHRWGGKFADYGWPVWVQYRFMETIAERFGATMNGGQRPQPERCPTYLRDLEVRAGLAGIPLPIYKFFATIRMSKRLRQLLGV
jgi:hypothetical protein